VVYVALGLKQLQARYESDLLLHLLKGS